MSTIRPSVTARYVIGQAASRRRKYSGTSRYAPQTMSERGERLASFLAATRPPQARTRGPASAAGCMRTAMTELSSGSRYRFTDAGGPSRGRDYHALRHLAGWLAAYGQLDELRE